MKEKKIQKKSGGGRTYNHVFTSPLLYHLHQHILLLLNQYKLRQFLNLIQFTYISDSMFQFNLTLLPSNSVQGTHHPRDVSFTGCNVQRIIQGMQCSRDVLSKGRTIRDFSFGDTLFWGHTVLASNLALEARLVLINPILHFYPLHFRNYCCV
jgi:hypothetical protein